MKFISKTLNKNECLKTERKSIQFLSLVLSVLINCEALCFQKFFQIQSIHQHNSSLYYLLILQMFPLIYMICLFFLILQFFFQFCIRQKRQSRMISKGHRIDFKRFIFHFASKSISDG
ncbi:nucleoporin seh1-like [Sarcoptes scabiei]|nr:nucleoporin seh1-like [Sarcoptes scabiei]